MISFYYIGCKPRYIAEDDFPMEDEYIEPFDPPEPDELERQAELDDLYERQIANDLNDCITDIQGQFAALFAMHRQAV